jgi:hypothetical protein
MNDGTIIQTDDTDDFGNVSASCYSTNVTDVYDNMQPGGQCVPVLIDDDESFDFDGFESSDIDLCKAMLFY